MSRRTIRKTHHARMVGRIDFKAACRLFPLSGLAFLTWQGGTQGLATLLDKGAKINIMAGALIAATCLMILTLILIWSADEKPLNKAGPFIIIRALTIFLCSGTGYVFYHSLLGGSHLSLTQGLAIALALLPPLLLFTSAKSLFERRKIITDSVPALSVREVLEVLGPKRQPTRAALQDALIWYEGAPHLVTPVTGPYEQSRASHIEDIITLCNLLSDQGYARTVRSLHGKRGAREALRTFSGTSHFWTFRQRFNLVRLNEQVLTELLGQVTITSHQESTPSENRVPQHKVARL